MSDTPILTGRDIGQAERATRALLDRLLFQEGATFEQWVVLNMLESGTDSRRPQLTLEIASRLRQSEDSVASAINELLATGLLVETAERTLTMTGAGRARFERIATGIDGMTSRLYSGLRDVDLAIARDVLHTVTGRALAELAG